MNAQLKISLILLVLFSLIGCNNGFDPKDYNKSEIKQEEPAEETKEPLGTGVITTQVDGMDVNRVNLWTSTSSDRKINCFLIDRDKIQILEDAEPYYLVESVKDNTCRGYCMKGFVIMD